MRELLQENGLLTFFFYETRHTHTWLAMTALKPLESVVER